MATVPTKSKSQTQGLLIALAILNMIGFLVLYFKVDLDSSLAAGDAGVLSQQITNIENRLNKVSIAMPTAGSEYEKVVASGNGFVLKASNECKAQYSVANGRQYLDDATGELRGMLFDVQVGGVNVGSIVTQLPAQFAKPLTTEGYAVAFKTDRLVVEDMFYDLTKVDAAGCKLSVEQIPEEKAVTRPTGAMPTTNGGSVVPPPGTVQNY